MNKSEQEYIRRIKGILIKSEPSVELVEEMAELSSPNQDNLLLNTKEIIGIIGDLQFERKYGYLDTEPEEAEQQLADHIILNVKKMIADIERDNVYSNIYDVTTVYSRLQGEDYQYELIKTATGLMTLDEATELQRKIKTTAPKELAEKPGFTLEDIRISEKLIDSHGNLIRGKAS